MLTVAVTAGTAAASPAASAPVVPETRQRVVFYIPHADDDVLSMGTLIQDQVRAGHDVEVVYYTDGGGSGVCAARDGVCRAADEYYGRPVTAFIADRDQELYRAVAALGVTPEHVTLYHPPGQPRRRDGTVDLPYATAMLRHFIQMYPDATHVTMSWLDAHADHGSAGQALRSLVEKHELPGGQALFSMARWYWAYDYPDRSNVLAVEANQLRATLGFPSASRLLRCPDQVCLDRIHQAAEAYRGPSDIGYRSVPVYFKVLEDDPAVLMHGVDTGQYPTRLTVTTGARARAGAPAAVISGAIALPSFGTYPAPLTSADRLAQTLRSNVLVDPFATRPVTVQAVDSAARVLGRSTATVRGGRFSAVVPVPPGATSVTATFPGTQGAAASSATWPVETQDVTPQPARGLGVTSVGVRGGYGQRFSVRVQLHIKGAAARGATVELASSGPAAPGATSQARTDVRGVALLSGTLSRSGSWRVTVTSASTRVVAPASTTVSTSAAPARLVLQPSASRTKLVKHVATLSGRLKGRDYDIAAGYLANASVRVWLERSGRKATLLATTRTRSDGTFVTRVTSSYTGVVRYELVGSPEFAQVSTAGTTTLS